MEHKIVVYNAAKDGRLNRLKIFLDHRTKDDVSHLVHSKTNGATPLIMACRNGHLDVVKYLIGTCICDKEQVGSVTFDGETIEGAPPLWCAAAAGHLPIVKYLIEKDAAVNKTTFTNSTPLRAACFDGHYRIVKCLITHNADIEIANRHGHTCLMISCYKGHYDIAKLLLELKADVNRKSIKGNTALHDCAESGSLDIMQLLLDHKAQMERDAYGISPLLAAALTGYTKIVEFLIKRADVTKSEQIDALEILGATYVDRKRDMMGALTFWKRAMEDRYSDSRSPCPKPVTTSRISAYENAVEVTNSEQLDELISDPDDMRMQALLIRERILGPAHPDTSYYIRYRGALYADMGNFERCIDLWMYALDMQQKVLDPLSPMTQSSFLSFAELFSFMTMEWKNRTAYPVQFDDVRVVLIKSVSEFEKGRTIICNTSLQERDYGNYNRLVVIIMHFLCLMCRMMTTVSLKQQYDFKKIVYCFISLNPRGANGMTPLHLACSKDTTNVGKYPVCAFPSSDVIRLLLEVGSEPNALDIDQNTPLHIAAVNRPCKADVMKDLLRNGAHLDSTNCDGYTPVQLMNGVIAITDIVSPLDYINLQCLAARTVKKFGLTYADRIPKKLEAFIEMH